MQTSLPFRIAVDPEYRWQRWDSIEDLKAAIGDRGNAAVVGQVLNVLLRALEVERKMKEAEELEERLAQLEGYVLFPVTLRVLGRVGDLRFDGVAQEYSAGRLGVEALREKVELLSVLSL